MLVLEVGFNNSTHHNIFILSILFLFIKSFISYILNPTIIFQDDGAGRFSYDVIRNLHAKI
jgi:hypothetical protein